MEVEIKNKKTVDATLTIDGGQDLNEHKETNTKHHHLLSKKKKRTRREEEIDFGQTLTVLYHRPADPTAVHHVQTAETRPNLHLTICRLVIPPPFSWPPYNKYA